MNSNRRRRTRCTRPRALRTALLVVVPMVLAACDGEPGDATTDSAAQALRHGGTSTACGTASEYGTLKLACPKGTVVSAVTFASYGTPGGTCGAFTLGACNAATSRTVVEAACLGKSSCSVAATNAVFGDPCVGVDKRLYVSVQCGGSVTTPLDASTVLDLGATARDLSSPPPADLATRVDLATTPDLTTSPDLVAASNAGRYFPAGAIWYQDVSQAPLDAQSAEVITWLNGRGWGGGRMQIDFSIEVLHADPGVVPTAFQKTADFFSPDCDSDPVPLPPGGALEGEAGYACVNDGDCHLLVTQGTKLYEMWRANVTGGTFYGGCLAVWDMTRVYGPAGRGDGCTSADAAGYPMAPLLFTADEVAAGHIDHAIRFILPNSSIRHGSYLHPATHSTGATSGGSSAPPYGTRLRLRAGFPLNTLPNEAARTVARAMQKYGMFLADGGQVALTAQRDRSTVHKWAGLLGALDLSAIQPGDFEMVDGGTRLPANVSCVRTPK